MAKQRSEKQPESGSSGESTSTNPFLSAKPSTSIGSGLTFIGNLPPADSLRPTKATPPSPPPPDRTAEQPEG